MKKVLIILLTLFLTGCNNEYISKNLYYMDTLINIKIYSNDTKKVNEALEYIDDLYKKYENITNYYNDSELYRLNNTSEEKVVSNELYELIKLGLDWYYESNGLLNINIGKLTSTWHYFRENKTELPSIDMLNNLDISIDNIKLKDNNVISGDFDIDLGSFVKGFVTSQAGEYLESIGLDYYIINAGGNVLVGKSHKGYYNIGIKSPIDESIFYVLKASNLSVVTSGGYERFYEVDGVLYHHIIDPNTRFPANYMKSVTVIGKSSTLCDLLSTTLFLMDIESGMEFIKDFDVDVIWFTNEGEIIKNEGFRYE